MSGSNHPDSPSAEEPVNEPDTTPASEPDDYPHFQGSAGPDEPTGVPTFYGSTDAPSGLSVWARWLRSKRGRNNR
jgi:hypothetical protein